MAELIYSEDIGPRKTVAENSETFAVHGERRAVFADWNKVCMTTSFYLSEYNYKSKSRYFFWKTVRSIGFRRTAAGTIVPINAARGARLKNRSWGHGRGCEVFTFLGYGGNTVSDIFTDEVRHKFDIESAEDLYPMMPHFGFENPAAIPTNMLMPFRQTDWCVFSEILFGKGRTNQALISAVQNAAPYFTSQASQFRGLVDDDMLVRFLKRNSDFEEEPAVPPGSPNIRYGMRMAEPMTVKGLADSIVTTQDMRALSEFSAMKPKNQKWVVERRHRGDCSGWADLLVR